METEMLNFKHLVDLDPALLLDVANVVGADRVGDLIEGKRLYTPGERVHRLEVDDDYPLSEMALPSDDSLDSEEHAQDAHVRLGSVIPTLMLSIRQAKCDSVKEGMVCLLDAALQAHRELGSYISRPGEFSKSKACNSLAEFNALAAMAKTLAENPHQEGPDVGDFHNPMANVTSGGPQAQPNVGVTAEEILWRNKRNKPEKEGKDAKKEESVLH